MGKWQKLFESSLPPVKQRDRGRQYTFGPPATAEELAAAEQALGIQLPASLRELFSEFNGSWWTSEDHRAIGEAGEKLFLDLNNLAVRVPNYFRNCGNILPPEEDLKKVVFFAQWNGFSDLWGVCVAKVAGRKVGEIVHLDHETGELAKAFKDLTDFVRRGPR